MTRHAADRDDASSFELDDPFLDHDATPCVTPGHRSSPLWLVAQLTLVPVLLMQLAHGRWRATRPFVRSLDGDHGDRRRRDGHEHEHAGVSGPRRSVLGRVA